MYIYNHISILNAILLYLNNQEFSKMSVANPFYIIVKNTAFIIKWWQMLQQLGLFQHCGIKIKMRP